MKLGELKVGDRFRFFRPSGLLSSTEWEVKEIRKDGGIYCEDSSDGVIYPPTREVLIERKED